MWEIKSGWVVKITQMALRKYIGLKNMLSTVLRKHPPWFQSVTLPLELHNNLEIVPSRRTICFIYSPNLNKTVESLRISCRKVDCGCCRKRYQNKNWSKLLKFNQNHKKINICSSVQRFPMSRAFLDWKYRLRKNRK